MVVVTKGRMAVTGTWASGECRSHMTSALALCRRLGLGQCRIPCIRLAAEEQYNYDSYSYKAKGDKAALFDWVGGFR